MLVIGHQDEGVQPPRARFDGPAEPVKPPLTIKAIAHDHPAFVGWRHHVVKRTAKFDSQRSCHGRDGIPSASIHQPLLTTAGLTPDVSSELLLFPFVVYLLEAAKPLGAFCSVLGIGVMGKLSHHLLVEFDRV